MENKILFEDHADRANIAGKVTPAGAAKETELFALQLHWPTDYRVVIQGFGINPELVRHRDLPGHEGLDIRAPLDARVYACADGIVEIAQDRIQEGDPYGRWVRILHAGGYRTLYAHFGKISVSRGSKVKAGQVLGLAGPTGENSGGYIHLSLKQDGATDSKLTQYPDDLIDPTPFLAVTPRPTNNFTYPWPIGRCLPGAAVNPDGSIVGGDFFAIASTQVEALKLGLQTNPERISRLRVAYPSAFFMTSLNIPNLKIGAARDWVGQIRPLLKNHVDAGIGYFEVHRAPNLAIQGCFTAWQSGNEFARWWLDALNMLKESYPTSKFGFPGLAGGPQIPGQRLDADIFMEQADEAILSADWIGVHSYWNTNEEMADENLGAREVTMRLWYPDKLLFITDYGNLNSLIDDQVKSRGYLEFLERVQKDPGIGAAFLSAS